MRLHYHGTGKKNCAYDILWTKNIYLTFQIYALDVTVKLLGHLECERPSPINISYLGINWEDWRTFFTYSADGFH
jgi:hypothetical protein